MRAYDLEGGGTICNFASGASNKNVFTLPLSFTWGDTKLTKTYLCQLQLQNIFINDNHSNYGHRNDHWNFVINEHYHFEEF